MKLTGTTEECSNFLKKVHQSILDGSLKDFKISQKDGIAKLTDINIPFLGWINTDFVIEYKYMNKNDIIWKTTTQTNIQ